MTREAMQLALQALELYQSKSSVQMFDIAVRALRQALETEQEPVISTDHGPWIPSTHPGEEGETYCKRCLLRDKFFGSRQCDPHIVYRDPPQRKPWVGLTDEEMRECAQAMNAEPLAEGWPELIKLARAIEAKLREKNT